MTRVIACIVGGIIFIGALIWGMWYENAPSKSKDEEESASE